MRGVKYHRLRRAGAGACPHPDDKLPMGIRTADAILESAMICGTRRALRLRGPGSVAKGFAMLHWAIQQ
jgi:hypothetical protein